MWIFGAFGIGSDAPIRSNLQAGSVEVGSFHAPPEWYASLTHLQTDYSPANGVDKILATLLPRDPSI